MNDTMDVKEMNGPATVIEGVENMDINMDVPEETVNANETEGTETMNEAMDVSEETETEMVTITAEEYAALVKAATKKSNKKKEYVFTPYEATKVMNVERRKLGLRDVGSPMLYIMAGKGKFKITIAADGRKEVDRESFMEWMTAHNARQLTK